MGFDAQAFATAFLKGQAVDIKDRFDKAEKFREEELEKAQRNLPLYKKRQAQKKQVLQMAQTLNKMGVSAENIMYFAKDGPQSLQAMYKIVTDKAKAYKGVTGDKMSEVQINSMMELPQGFEEAASEYGSLSDFLERAYSLSNDNDTVERPENAEIMNGNWLMGLMGYGAKEKERQRLETEKYVGDVSIAELNRMAGEQDFDDPFGGAFAPAPIDPSAGPRIIDDTTRVSIIKRKNTLFDKYTTVTPLGQTKLNAFLDSKGIVDTKDIKRKSTLASTILNSPETLTDERDLALFKEFTEQMEYEAFEEASIGFNRDDAERRQIDPNFQTLYEKFGGVDNVASSVGKVDYSTKDEFMTAIKGNLVQPGSYKVLKNGKVETLTITQDDINKLQGKV